MTIGTSVPLTIDEVSIREIRHPPVLLRDRNEELHQLAQSIFQHGLLQPILLRHIGDHFEIVAGNRRFEACKLLRLRKIPASIVELSDKEAFETALTENLQRKTLNPIEEAKAFKAYVEREGWGGLIALSQKIGKSQSYVSKRIKLLSLDQTIIDEIFRRRKNVTIAEEIFSLDPEDQLQIAKTVDQNQLSTREVRGLVKAIRQTRRLTEHAEVEGQSYETWQGQSEKQKLVGRCIDQTIVALRLALSRLDNVLDRLETQWLEKEILMQYRFSLHSQIDSLIRLKRKIVSKTVK